MGSGEGQVKHDPFQTVKYVVSAEEVPEKLSSFQEWTGLGLLLDILKPFCNPARGQPQRNAQKAKRRRGYFLMPVKSASPKI